MKAIINKKTYDTDDATKLGTKNVGEFGQANGYEEHLYMTKDESHFFYGVGGPKSPYPEAKIKRATKPMVEKWKKETGLA
ncbi:MAG: hypothetical protein FWB80_12675 [Defluviitaleaceae bacterium]|nr:hypothetical protein [Defluviitaleaceae bacterium]